MSKQTPYVGSRLFKVIKFGTNRKGICDFLLVVNSNIGHISLGFGATATYWSRGRLCDPQVTLRISLGMILCEYVDEPYIATNFASMGYPSVVETASSNTSIPSDIIPACDRQTDR